MEPPAALVQRKIFAASVASHLLYRINAADNDKEMHTIRILAELASALDRKSLEHLVSYGEYLVSQSQGKIGETFELPYQREQSAPV